MLVTLNMQINHQQIRTDAILQVHAYFHAKLCRTMIWCPTSIKPATTHPWKTNHCVENFFSQYCLLYTARLTTLDLNQLSSYLGNIFQIRCMIRWANLKHLQWFCILLLHASMWCIKGLIILFKMCIG